MKRLLCFSAATLCFLAITCVLAEDQPRPKTGDYIFAVPNFNDVPIEEGDKAAEAAIKTYNDLEANLLRQLKEAKTNHQKTMAIYLLGSLRSEKAIDDLVKNIDFEPDRRDPAFSIGRWGPYPAQDALVKIGSTYTLRILEIALGKEENELRRKLILMVILDSYGKGEQYLFLGKGGPLGVGRRASQVR